MEPTPGIEPESIAYQAIALPLSYADWKPWREFNPLPPRSERGALYGELQGQNLG
jgi:hypothetical protein